MTATATTTTTTSGSTSTTSSSSNDIIKITDLMKPGHTAVVTGASSGIGKAACLTFAKAGMDVWMLDVDSDELVKAHKFVKDQVEAAEGGGSESSSQLIMAETVDVSDLKAMELISEKVFASGHQNCNILMNNAGIGHGGGAIDTPIETVHKTMDVNLYGPIHGVQAFVPKMKTSNQQTQQGGIIINTGSKQGITMPPGNLTYNMSKAALKCFTEGLEHELMMDRRNTSSNSASAKLRAALLVPGMYVHVFSSYLLLVHSIILFSYLAPFPIFQDGRTQVSL
jgi:NAD(P)-dependent dehydrogenase (short-subunit alcohol dehydrogenase family)